MSPRRQNQVKEKPADPPATEPAASEDAVAADLTGVVGQNLRRLRTQRSLSLEGLARASGVSRAMLGQIELAQSAPTINLLWKIARALDVPFSALLRGPATNATRVLPLARSRILTSHDGTFKSRALFPTDGPRTVEFYELKLAPGATELAEPHPPGTTENLVVSKGAVTIALGEEKFELSAGDAIFFEADASHSYTNPGKVEALMFLVMKYAERSSAMAD